MIWKTVLVISVAHYVLSEHEKGAVSEQRISLHHSKSYSVDHPNGDKKSENHEEYIWENPSYEFSYKVNDPHTHDIKGQNEKRHGDEVKGLYWLLEPNGHKRTVNYNADDNKGFNAQVIYTSSEKHDENINDEKHDNNEYSVHEELIEDIVQNENKENNNETSNKEEIEEENNQEKNEAPEGNEEEKINEKSNNNSKESESTVDERILTAEEDGENVEVVVRPNGFNINNNDNDRFEHIQTHDIKRTIYENHKETNDKIEKYGDRNERRKKINLNNHADQINNSRDFSRQEKKKQGKNIISNNVNHKTDRSNEDTNQIHANEKRYKDQLSDNKDKNIQTNSNKSKSKTKEKESDTDNIYIGKLDDNNSQNNDESQIYEHRIFINHPKISASKQKKHRH